MAILPASYFRLLQIEAMKTIAYTTTKTTKPIECLSHSLGTVRIARAHQILAGVTRTEFSSKSLISLVSAEGLEPSTP